MASLHLAQQILDIMWPVGSIYLSDNATNPNTKFGGTWVRLSGGFIYGSTVASGSTYSTGNGSGTTTNNHTLTIDQIPNHSHGQYITANAGTGGPANRADYDADGAGYSCYPQGCNTMGTGGGKGHSHNIPYIACNIWRRIK